ncbi:WD40 repeat-like protein [Imleria badia]|nr:WD40 repeat-like protein [Imleria badia]
MSSVTTSETDRPEPHQVISVPDGYIRKLAYHPDGRRVVFCSDDGPIRVWNLEKREQEGTSMEHEDLSADRVAVTWDGTRIISGDENGKIRVWDVGSQEIVQEWSHRESFSRISVSPDDQLIAVNHRSNVFVYTMEGRQVYQSTIKVGKTFVWSISFSPGNDKLACGTRSEVYVYDVVNGTLILGPLKGHGDDVYQVLWSRNGSRLFSASDDRTIRCWSTDTGEQIGEPWTGHSDYIRSLSLSPDGSKLASASHDRTVRFWDTISGCPIITQPLEHGYRVYAVSFSPSGEFVASATSDRNIYLWRVPWLDPVESQKSHATRFNSILPDLSLDLDERQRIFEVRLRKVLDLATSKGFHVSRDLFPSSLPVCGRNAPSTAAERIADGDSNAMDASPIEPPTLVSGSNSNGDANEIRKVDKIKYNLVDMLREIVFKGSRGNDT